MQARDFDVYSLLVHLEDEALEIHNQRPLKECSLAGEEKAYLKIAEYIRNSTVNQRPHIAGRVTV